MKRLSIAFISTALFAGIASAGETFTFVPSIAYQNKHIDFDQKYTAGAFQGRKSDFAVDIPTINLTATGVYGKFYASYKYEADLTSASTSIDEVPEPGSSIYFLNTPASDETDIERKDQSITFGFNAWENLNLFVGYMKGRTLLTPDPMCPNACIGRGNLAYDHHMAGLNSYEQRYTEQGLFAGASYGFRIADIGTLSTSLAYAAMDGEYKDNYMAVPDEDFKFEGDSTGFSLGLTWSAPLTDHVGYYLDLRRQAYAMDAKDKSGNASWAGSKVETNETMLSATAGIQFYF